MSGTDLTQIAYLMRRAGFGASREELEEYVSKGYEAVVEDLVHPERFPEPDDDLVDRYYGQEYPAVFLGRWFYRMINGKRPLVEKMALFWHHRSGYQQSKMGNVGREEST